MRCVAARRATRSGAAVVELACLLPFLTLLLVAGVDFSRVFYHYLTITNCARAGAVYGSMDATHAADTTNIKAAALVDAGDLSPAPSVSSQTGTDTDGNSFVSVTVSYKFQTITGFPLIPSTTTITRTVQMRVAPSQPKNG